MNAGVPVADVRRDTVRRLTAAGVVDAVVDAELLIGHVLGMSRGGVQAAALRGDRMDAATAARLRTMTSRRAAREPLQHITGVAPFRRLELAVGPGVFVPRPETELIAQLAVDVLDVVPAPHPVAVDLGCGSGAIALAMATEVPRARVFAVERSPDALVWARRNVARYGADNTTLIAGDLADVPTALDGRVDVVASNPPYIPDAELPPDPEVSSHDPHEALYGGADGLDVIRVISRVGLRLARSGGFLVVEHTERQGAAVRALLAADGWRAPSTHRDLTTRDRATTALHP